MADITLRSYIREIDNLIEQEKLDEAIAHCRHVLQSYPKYIECYRLLGKAYLEAKRYGDAADIFQRVLSAVPDDFVSHIGMSIVREDEGNLDSAIWHMERGFETNPANPAIQQELKRLIGRSEGFEPHKVRLTRGALARMYAHGELYPQAIAELRSALQEDPDRPDLQVLLVELYWQTEQPVEAAEVSGRLLEKLPFCLKAVRIMAAVLQDRGKEDEAAGYHRRLAQLDPYMAYIESPMAEPTQVEADTIRLERLSWQPGQPLPASQPDDREWAAALGLDIEDAGEQEEASGPLPSWLDDDEETDMPEEAPSFERPPEEPDTPDQPAEEETEADIPEWMREAGWQESSGEAREQPVSFSSEELDALEQGELPAESTPAEPGSPTESDDEELAPAEIPSWLQGMAPEEDESVEDEGVESEEDQELVARLTAQQEQADEGQLDDIFEPDAAEAPPTAGPGEPEAAAETPAWMDQVEDEPDAPEPGASTDEPESADVPGWLDQGEPGATSTIMSWLGGRDSDGDDEPGEEPEPATDEAVPAGEAAPTEEPQEPAEDADEVPGWLSGVAEAAADTSTSDEQELAQFRRQAEADSVEDEQAEAGGEDVPAWLQNIAGEGEEAEAFEAEAAEPAAPGTRAPEETEADEAISWQSGVQAAEQDTVPQPNADEAEEPPAWLRSFGQEPADAATELEPEQTPAPEPEEMAGEAEDWLAELGAEAGADELDDDAAAWLSRLDEEEQQEAAAAAPEEEEQVPGWMQGLEEEEQDGEQVEDLADTWLADLSDTLAETPAEPGAAAGTGTPTGVEEEPEFEAAEPEPSASVEPEEDDEDLEWLRSLDAQEEPHEAVEQEPASPPAGDVPAPQAAADLDDLDDEGVFSWLDEMAAAKEEASEEEERPDHVDAADQPEQAEISAAAPPESYEEGLDWLEDLADRRGIDADVKREPSSASEPGPTRSEPERPDAAEDRPEPAAPTHRAAEPSEGDDAFAWEERAAAEADETPAPATPEATEPEAIEPSKPPEKPEPQAEPPLQAAPEGEGEQEMPAPSDAEPAAVDEAEEEVPDWLAEHAAGVSIEDEAKAPPVAEPDAEREAPAADEPQPWQPPEQDEPEAARPAAPTQAVDSEPEPQPTTIQPPQEQQEEPEQPAPELEQQPAEETPLAAARQALAQGDAQSAAARYGELIEEQSSLEQVVEDLEEALDDGADAPVLWQTLGDAYMRLERTKDAIQAYGQGLDQDEVLDRAREALASGEAQRAAVHYSLLIKRKSDLDSVIEDLSHAVEDDGTPVLWQTLGDAYMKAGRLDDSIQAYRKGMDTV